MLGISATGKGKSDENQRSRQLLKVLAISDVVIFKTRFVFLLTNHFMKPSLVGFQVWVSDWNGYFNEICDVYYAPSEK